MKTKTDLKPALILPILGSCLATWTVPAVQTLAFADAPPVEATQQAAEGAQPSAPDTAIPSPAPAEASSPEIAPAIAQPASDAPAPVPAPATIAPAATPTPPKTVELLKITTDILDSSNLLTYHLTATDDGAGNLKSLHYYGPDELVAALADPAPRDAARLKRIRTLQAMKEDVSVSPDDIRGGKPISHYQGHPVLILSGPAFSDVTGGKITVSYMSMVSVQAFTDPKSCEKTEIDRACEARSKSRWRPVPKDACIAQTTESCQDKLEHVSIEISRESGDWKIYPTAGDTRQAASGLFARKRSCFGMTCGIEKIELN